MKNTKEVVGSNENAANYENCANPAYNNLVLICETCKGDPKKLYHTEVCQKRGAKYGAAKV